MSKLRNFFFTGCLCSAIAGCAAPVDRDGGRVTDSTGVPRLPDPRGETVALVAFFVATECPISNSYAPEMIRIAGDYTPKKVRFAFVYSDPDLTEEQVKRHASEYGLDAAGQIVFDPTHLWSKEFGATVTPEAAIADGRSAAARNPVYLGRIDDLYVGFGKRRHEPTVRDLRNALDAVLAGKPVPRPGGKAIGCSIPEPRTSLHEIAN